MAAYAPQFSLNARLLIVASIVLIAFLGATGWALDRAFRESARAAVKEQLKVYVYSLLAGAELDDNDRLIFPDNPPEAKFSNPGSGLYAAVTQADGTVIWRSRSMLGVDVPLSPVKNKGRTVFKETTAADGAKYFTIAFSVSWEASQGEVFGYTFYVATSTAEHQALVTEFRRSLSIWLGAAAVMLLLAQALVLRWGLAPLRRVAREVREIEAGKRAQINEHYPKELHLLSRGMNNLIKQRSHHLERYRNALGDLAHSFKTPLAVIRGVVERGKVSDDVRDLLREQVEVLHRTVEYQLQRAAASGRAALSQPVNIDEVVNQIRRSLVKVYAEKSIMLDLKVEPGIQFHGDKGDLMEVIGNLLDNACKWSTRQVRLRATKCADTVQMTQQICIVVEDDGPGIPPDKRAEISRRGVRADPSTAGHGIGLAVVKEIVEQVYGGALDFGDSPLGGAAVRVSLSA